MDLTHLALLDLLAYLTKVCIKPAIKSDLKFNPRLGYGMPRLLNQGQGQIDGLLAEDVQTSGGRLANQRRMGIR